MELDGIIDTPKKDRRRKRESMSDNEFAAAGDSDAGDTDEDENDMKGTKPKKRVNSFQSTKTPSQSPKTRGGKDVRLTLTSAPPSKSPQQQSLRGRASRTVQQQDRSGKKISLPVGPVRGKAAPGKSIQEPNNIQKTRVPAPKQKPANVPASKSAKQQGSTNAPGKKSLKAVPKNSESENDNLQAAKSSKDNSRARITKLLVTKTLSSGSHHAGAEHSPVVSSIASVKEYGPSKSPLLSAHTQDSMTPDTVTSESANSTQSTIILVKSQYTIPNSNTSKNNPLSTLPTTNPSQKDAVDDPKMATSPHIKAPGSTPHQTFLPSTSPHRPTTSP
jgi:hypothetical protein